MLTADIFRLPAPTPVPPTFPPEAIEVAAGYGRFLPTDVDMPHAEQFADVAVLTASAITDLAAVPADVIDREVGRRATTYLQDFRGAGAVNVADLRAKARTALSREVAETRASRMAEVKTRLATVLDEGTRTLQAAHDQRRQVPIPVVPDPTPDMDPAALQLLETRRTNESHRRLLAALEVTPTASDDELLRRMRTDENPYGRQRAQDLLADRLPGLRAEAVRARAAGHREEAERLQAVVAAYHAAIADRVPPHIREAEDAQRQAWQVVTAQAHRLLLQINVAQQAGIPMDHPVLSPGLAERLTTTIQQARATAREAWRPVWQDVRQARQAKAGRA